MELACFFDMALTSVPDDGQARDLAEAVCKACLGTSFTSRGLIESMGWSVSIKTLRAREGGLQAAMSPSGGGYVFVVDPEPTPAEWMRWSHQPPDVVRARVLNFRLAHELAHVLFYGKDGRRMLAGSAAEEAFCDAFAEALIEPTRNRRRPDSEVETGRIAAA